MKKVLGLCMVAVIFATFLAAGVASADHHAVKVVKRDGADSYLTDLKGMTLYTFKKDTPGKSACEGPCVDNWPLYFREQVEAKDGLAAADFGTITRADGKNQTTYKGMPLYYYIKDAKPGDTMGQGVKGVWSVAIP